MKILKLRERVGLKNKGIVIWITLICAMMMVFVQRLYPGVMQEYFKEKFSVGISGAVGFSSATFYGYACMQIPAGILVDKIGVRKISMAGMFITAMASIIFTVTESYTTAYLMRFLIGAGTSVIIICTFKVQVLWFSERKFSLLSSLMAFLSNLGMYLGTVPLAIAVQNVGEKRTLYIIALISLIVFIFVTLIVKEKESFVDKTNEKVEFLKGFFEVIKNPYTYPPVFIIFFFISTMTSFLGFWGVSYLTQIYGMNIMEASAKISYLSVGFILGSFIVAFVDRIFGGDYRYGLRIFTGIYSALWIYLLIICKGKPNVDLIGFLFVMMGIVIMGHLLAFTAVKENNKLENTGIATSFTNTAEFIGSGIINFIIGFLLNKSWSIINSMKVLMVFSILAFISSFFVKKNKKSV